MQKTEIQAKFAKTLYRQKSEGLFFSFFLFPLTELEATTRHEKKTSPDHACAPLLTKTPPKKPGKKEQMGMIYDPNTSKKTKNRSQPISDHTLKNQNPATKPKKQSQPISDDQRENSSYPGSLLIMSQMSRFNDQSGPDSNSFVALSTRRLATEAAILLCVLCSQCCYSPSLVANTKLYKICASFSAVFRNFLLL
jgi:hypothetical protein